MRLSLKTIVIISCLLFIFPLLVSCEGDTDDLNENTETTESGGTLEEWKERINQNAGVESDAAATLQVCDDLLNEKAGECSAHDGWSVVNALEVTDVAEGQTYQLQDIRQGGCERRDPQHVETGTIVTQEEKSSSYQVSCNLVCVWWDCEGDTDIVDDSQDSDTPIDDENEDVGDDEEGEGDSQDESEETQQATREIWSGTITTKLEDLGASCSGGDVAVAYTFTLYSPVSLVAALQGTREITLWSDPNYEQTSGMIQGTATILAQPPHEGVIYCELEEGRSEDVALAFYATGDEQVIQLSEVPGSDKNIRTKRFGKELFYHEEVGITDEYFLAGFPPLLQATSISETEISGVLQEGYGFSGTFELRKE